MGDSHQFASQLSPEPFDSDSFLGLPTAWMDDEQFSNVPVMDVFADKSTEYSSSSSSIDFSSTIGKTVEQDSTTDVMINAELGDHDTQLLDAALDLPFDTELSPILEPFADITEAMSPLKMQRRNSRSPRMCRTISSPLRKTAAATTPRQANKIESNKTEEQIKVLGVTKRPRTRSTSWQEREQNTFFSLFKVKWPPSPEGEPRPPFSSLLLQRFDAISTKIRTKNVMEVRQFYTTVLQRITEMLDVVDNDVDLTNPDQVRIAVWCWSKLMADKKHHDEFQTLSSAPAFVKTNLANVLLQSIIRSRRQMLKAKPENSIRKNNSASSPGLSSISAWVSKSNLSSGCGRAGVPVPETSTVQIHHPMVRKKHSVLSSKVAGMLPASSASMSEKVLSSSIVQQHSGESHAVMLKRKRSVSTDRCLSPGSAKKNRRAPSGPAVFSSPSPTDMRSRTRNGVAFHTPRQLSRKKFYIKMRMVPRDKHTKEDVVRCGCRPKVELKLSSTKKISEITAHMAKKWAKIRPLLPKGAVLYFFQKNGTDKWSNEDSNVTCFDIWKQSGKQTNGENVVEVSYMWMVPEKATKLVDCEKVHSQELMPMPPELFAKEMCAFVKQTPSSGDISEVALLSSARDLQEFGEKGAFSIDTETKVEAALTSDSCDEDIVEEFSSSTRRLRRRIKPELVSKQEFNI